MIALLLVLCCGSAQAVEPGPESPTAGESPPGVMEVRVVPPEERAWDALAELDPESRQALVQRLLDEGLIEPPVVDAGWRADRRALVSTVEERLAAGRTALRAGRPDDAIRVLGPVRDDPRVQPFWTEAVDAHVYARRELAGRWFARGVRLTGSERTAALGEAREILVALVRDYPDSVYAEPVLDALERVERALDGTR